jgi:hypothetical protein
LSVTVTMPGCVGCGVTRIGDSEFISYVFVFMVRQAHHERIGVI